jgi:hypothetical protein
MIYLVYIIYLPNNLPFFLPIYLCAKPIFYEMGYQGETIYIFNSIEVH